MFLILYEKILRHVKFIYPENVKFNSGKIFETGYFNKTKKYKVFWRNIVLVKSNSVAVSVGFVCNNPIHGFAYRSILNTGGNR